MRTYNDKPVYDSDSFDYDAAKVGDYVTDEVVQDAINAMPPACMRLTCSQLGEPYIHREDPATGKWRPTYATFKCIHQDGPRSVWEYCGHCFQGETTERGKDPYYVGRSDET